MKIVRILLACAMSTPLAGLFADETSLDKDAGAEPVPFVAWRPATEFPLPAIVLQYDASTKSGANWTEVNHPRWYDHSEPIDMGRAAEYLRDGLKRMTGKEFPVVSTNDLSQGIVLTLFKNAPADIRSDPEVQRALREDPQDPYAANESFLIRSETNRVLVVARTVSGLLDGVVELLESVDYEILGMGPDWIHAPDHRDRPLTFAVNRSGRATFYIRNLWAHSGQSYGIGTIMSGLSDPADESVDVSSCRWVIGARLFGQSMPPFPGHALQAYHARILDRMRAEGSTEGFLSSVRLGLEAQRPPADPAVKNLCWINTDPKGTPGFEKISICDGKEWQPNGLGSVDQSSRLVREIVFEDMKQRTEAEFKANPDDPLIFPMDSEDGETPDRERDRTMAHKNWYPEYLAQEKLPFGRPYRLHGFKGLNQPTETWDPSSASDTIFGFACYLLHEYDKWIDALPEAQRVTSTGKSKKALIRCSLQSYNYHDVPPNFNPDPRVRASVAPFPKHRGVGKWEKFATPDDIAKALQLLLPDEPSANYFFYSFSYYGDGGPDGVPARWSAAPTSIAERYRQMYDVGFRSIAIEMDFNFGKYGLGYYLASKMLWNAKLTAADLDALRDRWLQRSFGRAWQEVKAYYDFMLPENYPVNSPNVWAKAIRLIDAADKSLDADREPAAQRRIDDVKQYWYVHYLMDSGLFAKNSPEVKEFLWKGQMSYMVGMQGLLGRDFQRRPVQEVVGAEISKGPAHYTHAETQAWWAKVLDFWKVTPVTLFVDGTLANGLPARSADLNNLTAVKEFQSTASDDPFLYNSAYMKYGTVLMTAATEGDPLGFKLIWPFNPLDGDYIAKKVAYGVDIWDPVGKMWQPWMDKTMTYQQSVEVTGVDGRKRQVADVQLKAPRAGTYRFILGTGGNLSCLASPAFDPVTWKYAKPTSLNGAGYAGTGFTYCTNAEGLTQSPVYFYIPKGTKSLDMEVWDAGKFKFVTFFKGLPNQNLTVSRKMDISAMGAHSILLQPGEDGSLAMISGNNFFFPFLYSVPTLWAKSPAALLVPRGIAEADGLTSFEPGRR